MPCAVQALLEKVRSFHSSRSLITGGASSQSAVSRSGRRLAQSQVLSGLTIHEAPEEQSLPTSSTAAFDATKDQQTEEEEYLIRCHNLDEFEDSEIPAICLRHRGVRVSIAADAADVVAKTTESKVDDQQTVSQPTTSSAVGGCRACKTVVEGGVHQDSSPPETGVDRDGTQEPGTKLRDKRRVSLVETPQTNYYTTSPLEMLWQKQQLEEKRQKEKAWENEEPTLSADYLTADVTLLTIPDADKLVPLSESAIRASDVVTVDILERVITDDLRQLSANCSQSLCVYAALIVSRVLDSARNKVMRENRLPPAATWREKARREAFLLVEDVLSSAAIYVSLGGAVYARPPTQAMSSTDDDWWVASTDDEQSLHDQLPQQQSQKLSAKRDDRQDYDVDADEKDNKPAVSSISMAAQSSLTAGVSIIGMSQHGPDDVHKHEPEPEPASKADPSAEDLSLAHLSIIREPQISQISRDIWTQSDAKSAPLQATSAPSILKTSSAREASAVSKADIDAGDDPISWQQLFSKSRQSSVLSNVSSESYQQEIANLRQMFSHGNHQQDDLPL